MIGSIFTISLLTSYQIPIKSSKPPGTPNSLFTSTQKCLLRILKHSSKQVLENVMKRSQTMANLSRTSKLALTLKMVSPITKDRDYFHTTTKLPMIPTWQELYSVTYSSTKRSSTSRTCRIAKIRKVESNQALMKNQKRKSNHQMMPKTSQ